ncbi:hypothetical protein RD792_010353 [Penstemon davidsonii]|uniref:Uncharacterized protein n=1 Tax=Penstemon davidsonii TaxID=160366 RepID=A0ABR0D3F9_9LAMI|nr:hypothetical protein RD792_010353 [Penstemon davidsonii]
MVSKNLDSCRGYIRVGQEPVFKKPVNVPKGYMAVYVGQKDGDFERVLVPVECFNHPLFGDLLKESEEEYGFNHPVGLPYRVVFRNLGEFGPGSSREMYPENADVEDIQ